MCYHLKSFYDNIYLQRRYKFKVYIELTLLKGVYIIAMNELKVSKNELKHSARGIFSYINRKPTTMLKGGHGESNVVYLQKNSLPYKINKTDINGVRHGQIDCHIRPQEKKPFGHVWFPKNWGEKTISKAGNHVANLKKNANKLDHTAMVGKYRGVYVVTYKSRGRICGVCPKFKQT